MIEKAIGRRGILGLLLGAGAASAAPAVITVKAAAAALGVDEAMSANEIAGVTSEGIGPTWDTHWRLISLLERTHYAKRRPVADMPSHISTKRSWSPTFKAMIHAREEAIMQAYFDKLRMDQSFTEKLLGQVFGGQDDPN